MERLPKSVKNDKKIMETYESYVKCTNHNEIKQYEWILQDLITKVHYRRQVKKFRRMNGSVPPTQIQKDKMLTEAKRLGAIDFNKIKR